LEGAKPAMENQTLTISPELQTNTAMSLQESVSSSLSQYFSKLDGQPPENLYELVLAEVEKPLLEMVLKLTNGNQSKAAIVLGLSRGTLRKKMAQYDLN
jgi:Fis family transcriptional regulator